MRRNASSPAEAIRYSRSIGNIVLPQNIITSNNSYRGIGYGAEASIIQENGRNIFGVIAKKHNPFKIFEEWQKQGWGGSETLNWNSVESDSNDIIDPSDITDPIEKFYRSIK
jgi:hypothetical protein